MQTTSVNSHISYDQILAFFRGQLTKEERKDFILHTTNCELCLTKALDTKFDDIVQ